MLFSEILKFGGVMFAIFGVLGFVLHLFDMEISVYGSNLGDIDLSMAAILVGIGAFLFGIAYLIGRRKKAE